MDQTVTWAVNGTTGGNATVGRISTTGVYTAPAALPTPNSVSIEATSSSNPSLSGKSSIMLENPVPTVTTVSPAAVPVGNFSVTITGSKFVNGAEVMFGGQALTTKFVSATQLTATGTTTAAQKGTTVQLTVSNPDPGAMASSALMIKVGAPQVNVTITPASVQLRPGQTVQFKAAVSGTTNTAVNWEVNATVGGDPVVGTISTSGLYTAPSVLPDAGHSTLAINAISVEGNTYNPPAYVSLLSGLPVLFGSPPHPRPGRKLHDLSEWQQLPGWGASGFQRHLPDHNLHFADQSERVRNVLRGGYCLG